MPPLTETGRVALIADRDAVHEKQLLNFHRFEVRLERSIRCAIQQLRHCRAERLAADANQTENVSGEGRAAIGFGLKTSQGPQIVPPQPLSEASGTTHGSPAGGRSGRSRRLITMTNMTQFRTPPAAHHPSCARAIQPLRVSQWGPHNLGRAPGFPGGLVVDVFFFPDLG